MISSGSFTLKVYSPRAHEHMDVRMKLKIPSEGVATANDGGKEMPFFRPGKHRLTGGLKEAIEQESIFIKKLS
jgi:hypothetical protein